MADTDNKVLKGDGLTELVKKIKGADKGLSDRIDTLEGATHTHSNKALLDTYTQSEADLSDAVSKKHSHSTAQTNAMDSGITATKVSSYDTALTYIPDEASATNKLADKAYVDAIGERLESRYLASSALGEPFATHAALTSATKYYYNGKEVTPDTNDVTVVMADEDHTGVTGEYSTTRYRWVGDSKSGSWAFEYVINNSALSTGQLLAVNSGITATKVAGYDSHLTDTDVHVSTTEKAKWDGKQDTIAFDGTYNKTTNKAATVSTVNTAIQGLDGVITGTAGAGKTLTALSETDGVVSATFSDISITKSQVSDFPSTMTPSSHAHGNIQNGGTLQGTDVGVANGDKLVITDASDSDKVARASVAFDGTTTTKALTPKGTWETFAKAADITTAIQGLDGTVTGTPDAGKTLTAFSETDGVVTATFSDISITKSQVSDFPKSMTPTSHTHGNLTNAGALQTNDITAASGDKLVVTDSSDANHIARTSIAFDGSTTTTALTPKGTWEAFAKSTDIASAIQELDGTVTGTPGTGKTLTAFSETDGKVSATFGDISITKSQVSDFSHAHGNIQNGGTLQTNDVTVATGDKLVITDSSDSSKVARASVSFDGSTTTTALTPKGTWESFAKASDITTAIQALDGTVTGTPGAGKTLTAFSETDGKVSATFSDISITKSQVSDFPSTMTPSAHTHGNIQNGGTLQTTDITVASGDKLVVTDSSDSSKVARTSVSFDGSTTTKALTPKGTWESFAKSSDITSAIQALDGTVTGTPGAGKTLTAFSETDGKVSATFSDISITKSQVSDFPSKMDPTDHAHGYLNMNGELTNAVPTVQSGYILAVSEADTDLYTGRLAKSSIIFDGATTSKALTPKGTWETFLKSGDISGKADKVSSATSGDIATLDANGNLVDSGKKPGDYVPVESESLDGKTTTILNLVKALQAIGIDYKRYDTTSDGYSSGISDKPTGTTSRGFMLECFRVRSVSDTDWEYQLVCRVHGDTNPYKALVSQTTTAISWSRMNTDTDTKVTETLVSDNAEYPLLLTPKAQSATTTTTAAFDSGVTLNPSTNTITGHITGNSGSTYALGNGNAAASNTFDGTKTVQLITGAMSINASKLVSGRTYMIANANGSTTDATITLVNDLTTPIYRRLNGGTTTVAASASDNALSIKPGMAMFIHVMGTTYVLHRTPIVDGNGAITGSITGNANTATTATTANNVSAVGGTVNAARHVWFSDSVTEGKRNYDDDFKYNPSTNTLTVGTVDGVSEWANSSRGTFVADHNLAIPEAHPYDSTLTTWSTSETFASASTASHAPNSSYNWHIHAILIKIGTGLYRVAQLAFGTNANKGTCLFTRSGISSDLSTWEFGSWLDANIDTKNTAGATDTTSKIFLVGATAQTANPQTYSDSEVYVQNGTLYAVKNTDASGTVNNKPALIVGGTDTAAHIEIDPNEIMAKSSGTATGPLYLNNDGGSVYVNGKLVARDAASKGSSSVPVYTNANGDIIACTDDFVHDGDVVSTYSATGTNPVNGTAVAEALKSKAVGYIGEGGFAAGNAGWVAKLPFTADSLTEELKVIVKCASSSSAEPIEYLIQVTKTADTAEAVGSIIIYGSIVAGRANARGAYYKKELNENSTTDGYIWIGVDGGGYYSRYTVFQYNKSTASFEIVNATLIGSGASNITMARMASVTAGVAVGSSATPVYADAAGKLIACTTANLRAGKDGDGNTISSTYLKLSGGTMSGNINMPSASSAFSSTGLEWNSGGSFIGTNNSNGLGLYATTLYLRPGSQKGTSSEKGLVITTTDLTYNGSSIVPTSTYSSAGTAPVTGTAVASAIGALDVTAITGSTLQTITSISETDGKISATYSNIATMGAATSTTAGTSGLVPAPGIGKEASFLRGDGTWVVPANTDTKVTETLVSDNAEYPLLLTPKAQTATTTTTATFDSGVTLNPSTNTITANLSGNATTSSYPSGFNSKVDSVSWGKLKTTGDSPAYTCITDWHTTGGADIAFVTKTSDTNKKVYVQIDGQFYQNEGNYRVLDTSDVTSTYSSTGTSPVNGTAIAAAIGDLDVTAITGSSTKTITSISETDGKISATYSDIATMGAATASAAGTKGLVPAPAAGKQASFLRGDGTWAVPANTDTMVTQSVTTTANYRPIVFGAQNDTTHTTLSNTVTNQVYTTNTMYAQPSTGMIAATSFKVAEKATFQYNSTDNAIDLVW